MAARSGRERPVEQQWRDTEVLPGSPGWHDTAVLIPVPRTVAAGWYADPYDATGLRFWDGYNWTDRSSDTSWFEATGEARKPRKRRSVLLGFVLAFFFGVLAAPYVLPLPGWARLLLAAGLVVVLGWWTLLIVPLTWPLAIFLVPLFTALLNPPR
jgi:hypothetical protein